uniref:Uncharacterized protein n=1 Tax=Octopus bimaculoides TaxID=37653 RepID=A0A0L8FR81_OCTBM
MIDNSIVMTDDNEIVAYVDEFNIDEVEGGNVELEEKTLRDRERERHRQKQRETQTEAERDTDRSRERHRQKQRETQTEAERDRERERWRDRDRKTAKENLYRMRSVFV